MSAPASDKPAASAWPLAGRSFGAVLLDLDSTLIDSSAVVDRSWLTWATEFGITPADRTEHHGVPARTTVARLLPDEQRERALERIRELEENDTDGIRQIAGAQATLDRLAGLGVPTAIVTSCTVRLADARITATGLRVPVAVVTADDVTEGKPGPEPYLAGARMLDVPIDDCLVVEDAPAGFVSGRDAGCAALLGLTTTHPRHEVEEWADAVVGTLAEVTFEPAGATRVAVEPIGGSS